MNTIVTSKEEILAECRKMVSEEGLQAINIRTVARRCNVSVGSIYYYFSGKNELALETIESVWMDIFNVDEQGATDLPFPEYVEWIFQSVRDGVNEYPNFFTAHSLGFASDERGKARSTMFRFLAQMKSGLSEKLKKDSSVREGAFSDDFPESAFLDFI
ncbi:MAG: TetR/AcrR family transcriptional regulator, partial [Bacteroidales bacterium]